MLWHSGNEPEDGPIAVQGAIGIQRNLWSKRWPTAIAGIMVAAGMLYMFMWDGLVHHVGSWATGGDLWGIFRGAHYVGWGLFGGIYTPSNGVISFPGMEILLAPVALLSSAMHLTESDPFTTISRPTAALILQPLEVLLAGTVVFAADAMGKWLKIGSRRRIALCCLVGGVAWPVAALWGHAEDVLAVTFVLYALLALFEGRWSRCGWLLGCALVMQPLVILVIPLMIGATPSGHRLGLTVRSAVLSLVAVGAAFVSDPSDTYRALVKQPTPPSVNHPTPWISFAPHLTSGRPRLVQQPTMVQQAGHVIYTDVTSLATNSLFVAGGPGRTVDLGLATLLGVYVLRRPQSPVWLLWWATLALASRCLFESVMTPYYIAPALLFGIILAARRGPMPLLASGTIAAEVTYFAYLHLNPWFWWLTIVAALTGIVALACPSDLSRCPEDLRGQLSEDPETKDGACPTTTTAPPPSFEPALT
jgi:hypothetical protein